MRILVFQHVDCEHPGSLRQFLAEDGIEWDAVYFIGVIKSQALIIMTHFGLWAAQWMSGI